MEAVVKSLDPNSTASRDAVLDIATEIIGHVVKTYVSPHCPSPVPFSPAHAQTNPSTDSLWYGVLYYKFYIHILTIPGWKDGPHEQAPKTRGDEACAGAYIKKEQCVYNAEMRRTLK